MKISGNDSCTIVDVCTLSNHLYPCVLYHFLLNLLIITITNLINCVNMNLLQKPIFLSLLPLLCQKCFVTALWLKSRHWFFISDKHINLSQKWYFCDKPIFVTDSYYFNDNEFYHNKVINLSLNMTYLSLIASKNPVNARLFVTTPNSVTSYHVDTKLVCYKLGCYWLNLWHCSCLSQ